MGLFGPSVALDEDLEHAFIGDSKSERKMVARNQTGIRAMLQPQEQVKAIAVDHYTSWPTLIVTDRRLLVMGRGANTLQRSIDPDRIDQAAAGVAGDVLVVHDDGTVTVRVGTYANAQSLVRAIHDALLAGRPRSIPTLYPTFFLDLLAEVGTPATPINVSRFVERTFVMLAGQATTFFEQRNDPRAQAAFAERFKDGGPEERALHAADDVIDWLWQWNPGCHRALDRVVRKWRDGMLMPHSFLHTDGGDITPWSEWASK